MKKDYDFISKSTGLYVEITGSTKFVSATFGSPAEGGEVFFKVYSEDGQEVTHLSQLEFFQISHEAEEHIKNEEIEYV